MKTIITLSIAQEIKGSISQFQSMINKEESISYDLRKHNKVTLYKSKVQELEQALLKGWI
jgi:hypothetical protein